MRITKSLSTSKKNLLVVFPVTGAVLCLLFLASIKALDSLYVWELKQSSVKDIRVLSLQVNEALWDQERPNKLVLDEQLPRMKGVDEFYVHDRFATRLYAYSADSSKHAALLADNFPRRTTATLLANTLVVRHPVVRRGKITGLITIVESNDLMLNNIRQYTQMWGIILCGIFLLVAGSTLALRSKLYRQITLLNNFVKSIRHTRDYTCRLVTTSTGEIRTLVASFNDLLEQIQEQEQVREMEACELRESEGKFRAMTELLPQPLFETDPRGNLTFLNRIGLHMFGIDRDDICNGVCLIDFLESDVDLIEIAKGETEVPLKFFFFDVNCKASKGNAFPATVYYSPIVKHNEFLGLRGFIIEISERVKFEDDLKAARSKAEQSDLLKSKFMANLSHEIRTPLNTIIGFADLLTDATNTQAEQNEYISYINKSGKVLSELIDDIIDLSKIEAGQLNISNKFFDLNSLVRELQTTFTDELKRRNKSNLIFNFCYSSQGHLMIKSDPVRLRQVFINLLANALKFTDSGFISLKYTINERPGAMPELLFIVEDTGLGIPREQKDLIFNRFIRLDNPKQQFEKGAGLGLTITKNLVELLGGHIWVESERGQGAKFYFTIPFVTRESSSEPIPVDETRNSPASVDWTGKTILVAEDEELNFEFIRAALEDTNVNIVWAQNGIEAVEHMQQGTRFDAVLMDIKMPEMNGLEATRIIRGIKGNKLPIIAQTAFSMAGDKEKCLEAGCTDYLAKPLLQSMLISTIHKHMKTIIN